MSFAIGEIIVAVSQKSAINLRCPLVRESDLLFLGSLPQKLFPVTSTYARRTIALWSDCRLACKVYARKRWLGPSSLDATANNKAFLYRALLEDLLATIWVYACYTLSISCSLLSVPFMSWRNSGSKLLMWASSQKHQRTSFFSSTVNPTLDEYKCPAKPSAITAHLGHLRTRLLLYGSSTATVLKFSAIIALASSSRFRLFACCLSFLASQLQQPNNNIISIIVVVDDFLLQCTWW
jgi:hypothetical protein